MPEISKPQIGYWHLWTDVHGISHQTRCVMTQFELQSISGPAQPQWQGQKTKAETTIMVTVLPVGWIGEWHENPRPQWIVPLSGHWFVESMDGQRVEMGPGEISFGADQHTKERDGKQGHFSGNAGDQPAVLMLVQFEVSASPTLGCPFP
jgi:hypothetical protein